MKRWLYQIPTIAALVIVMGGRFSVHAALVHSPKHRAGKKHHLLKKKTKESQEIYLSNDDLPRDGHHYVMVPPAWTPPDYGSNPNPIPPSSPDSSASVE